MNYLKEKFTKQLLSYFSGQVLAHLFSFVFQPLILFYILPSEYGYWSLFLVFFNLFKPITSFMMSNGFTRIFFEETVEQRQKNLSSIFWFFSFTSVLFLLLIIFFFPSYARISYYDKTDFIALALLIFSANFLTLAKTVIQLEKRFLKLSIIEVVQAGIFYIVCYTLVQKGFSWEAYYYSLITAVIFVNILAYLDLFRKGYLIFFIRWENIKKLLSLSLGLIPYGVGIFIIAVSDRVIIDYYLSIDEVGIYSLGYSLSSVIVIFGYSFYNVWSTHVLEKLNKEERELQSLMKLTYTYFISLIILSVLIYIAAYFYISWFIPQEFQQAKSVLIWFIPGLAFYCGIFFVKPFFDYIKCSFFLSFTTVISMILNIVLTIFFVQTKGIVGAGQATFITYLFCFLSLLIYLQYRFPLPWFKKIK